jgi:tetraacyldisaccharide 4'-kinase
MTTASTAILAPLAALYGGITRTRLALYKRRLLNSTHLDAIVISIGNLTTGGTGKTPMAEYLARTVAGAGRKVCILTRGYGREKPSEQVLVSDGQKVLATAQQAGDEPVLLAEQLRGIAAVISNANRVAAGRWAIANLGSEVFILDDGFQHLQVHRDLNIVTVDASNPWGNGHLLPRGRLREPRHGLTRADCIVITRSDQAANIEALKSEVKIISGHRPLFTSSMRAHGLRRLDEQAASDTGEMPGPVAAFSAIGNHASFIKQLESENIKPAAISEFPDHHRYSQRDIHEIVETARNAGAQSLITTAKDAVKLKGLTVGLPCYVLDIKITFDDESGFARLVSDKL